MDRLEVIVPTHNHLELTISLDKFSRQEQANSGLFFARWGEKFPEFCKQPHIPLVQVAEK